MTQPFTFQWSVPIPLRDGVSLNATLYLPKLCREVPAPCVFTLTPYISDTYHDRGVYFASHGLPFAIIDVRGRGNSQGSFRPYLQEAQDGHDIVEWLARQPYCNGQVAMWGGSYAGYNQWTTAKERPAHLATIVPVASPFMGVDFPLRSNVFTPYAMQWVTFTSGRASQRTLFEDIAFWNRWYREHFESGAPLNTFDERVGNPSSVFQEWLAHPHPDDYWDNYNPTPKQYAALDLPILTITGSYDDDQIGALTHYREHMRNAPEGAKAQHYLVIGPWDHAGTRAPKAQFGGLEFGPGSLLDLGKLHLDWYRWTMQGAPQPEFLKKRVAYYVMGAEEWRYADTLEAVTGRVETYYLHSSSNPSDVFRSGSISPETPSQSPPDRYRYDPRDVRSAELQSSFDPTSFVEQRLISSLVGQQLVYHSIPLENDLEVSGFFKFSAWLAIDQLDTDFCVSIYEILPNGNSILLVQDYLRARYRESVRKATLLRTTAPLRYDFANFPFVSRRIGKGSRIRLVVGPINSIFLEKNFNSGGVVTEESAQGARAVTVFLHHDHDYPSALSIPIGRE